MKGKGKNNNNFNSDVKGKGKNKSDSKGKGKNKRVNPQTDNWNNNKWDDQDYDKDKEFDQDNNPRQLNWDRMHHSKGSKGFSDNQNNKGSSSNYNQFGNNSGKGSKNNNNNSTNFNASKLTCCIACGFILGLNNACNQCLHFFNNNHNESGLTPTTPPHHSDSILNYPCYMFGTLTTFDLNFKICGPQLGANRRCPLCNYAILFLLSKSYSHLNINIKHTHPKQTNLLIARDRFFAHWQPYASITNDELLTPQQRSNNEELVTTNFQLVSNILNDFRLNSSKKSYDDPPYSQLAIAFDSEINNCLNPIKFRRTPIAPSSKDLHSTVWNSTDYKLHEIIALGAHFNFETLYIIVYILEALLRPQLPHHYFLHETKEPFRSPSCDYIDLNHLPIQHMLNASWSIMLDDANGYIPTYLEYLNEARTNSGLQPIQAEGLTNAHLLEMSMSAAWGGDWPGLVTIHMSLSHLIAKDTQAMSVLLQTTPWTNNILKVASTPGAWLADALHTAIISFYKPKQELKQHWAPNQSYVNIHDLIVEALYSEDIITKDAYETALGRNYNNKGNSIETLALWLWNGNHHLMLFTLIVAALAFAESTQEWAPQEFTNFC